MLYQPVDKPRLLKRMANVVRTGLPRPGRYQRYIASVAPVLLSIWIATGTYLVLAPQRYTSNFTFILPGSGVGSSLNVESIGQAQSTAASAFSSNTLSPTENYKRLLTADVTIRHAAILAQSEEAQFPVPAIKLVDQTNLIEVAVVGATPNEARHRAKALRRAFLRQLDTLRQDEAAKREVADARHLKQLETKVRDAQQKLIRFQAANDLASLDQFNARLAGVDSLREKEREARTNLRQQSAEAGSLSSSLGAKTSTANMSLRLRSDPIFQKLLDRFAVLDADVEQKKATLGPKHIDFAQTARERWQVRVALTARGNQLTGLSDTVLMKQVDLSVSDGRSSLLEDMIKSSARKAGTGAALAEIRTDLASQQAKSNRLVNQASELADLTRDHRIAEAVFSSALARLDTNKQDPFASYPLVQTLEDPSLPKATSSPSTLIALGGAVAASFLLLIGFGLLWLRQPIIRKLFPNG